MTTTETVTSKEEATEAKELSFTEETVKEPLIDLRITEDGKVSHFKVIKKFRTSSEDKSVKYRYALFMNGKFLDHYYWNARDDYSKDEVSKGFEMIREILGKINIAISQIELSNERIEEAKKTLATYLPDETAKVS